MKRINFVYSRNKLDFKRYVKLTDYDDIISYHDIVTKLVKNDDDNDKPSEYVVNSYLRKKIIKTITDEISCNIVYALRDLSTDTIDSICNLMKSFYKGSEPINFELTIVSHKRLEIDENYIGEIEKLSLLDKISYINI